MLIKKGKLKAESSNGDFHHEDAAYDMPDAHEVAHEMTHQAMVEHPEIEVPEEVVEARIEEIVREQEARLLQKEEQASAEIDSKIREANEQAEAILNEAHLKKEEFDHAMQEELQRVEAEKTKLEEAFKAEKERGYQEGFGEGSKLTDDFRNLLSSYQNVKNDFLKDSSEEIASIALDVAKQILQKEVKASDKVLQDQISRSIAKVVQGKGKVQVTVNPEDLEACEKLRASIGKTLEDGIELIFLGDAQVDAGSCIIETKGGRFDASFKTQLEVIKKSFEKYLGYEIEELEEAEAEIEESTPTKKTAVKKAKLTVKKTTKKTEDKKKTSSKSTKKTSKAGNKTTKKESVKATKKSVKKKSKIEEPVQAQENLNGEDNKMKKTKETPNSLNLGDPSDEMLEAAELLEEDDLLDTDEMLALLKSDAEKSKKDDLMALPDDIADYKEEDLLSFDDDEDEEGEAKPKSDDDEEEDEAEIMGAFDDDIDTSEYGEDSKAAKEEGFDVDGSNLDDYGNEVQQDPDY